MFVVIGTTTADLLVRNARPSLETGADGFRSGNVVFTETPPRLLLGGNGGISAYVLAGLGAPTALVSAVGRDLFGHTLLAWLEDRGVDVEGVIRSDAHATSTSVILSSDAASQVAFHHLGATANVLMGGAHERVLAGADVLLASSYPLIPALRNGGLAEVFADTEASGGTTALDIGPAIGDRVTLRELASLVPQTHYLFGNTHEICQLTETDDWESAATDLLTAGARCVVVKRGGEGASLRSRAAGVDAPAFAVEANISVGAGDAFDAGFLWGVHRGLDAAQALRVGNAVAALVVSGERGVLDAPTWDRVDAFLRPGG